VDDALNGPLPI
jgi:hypothetical protein